MTSREIRQQFLDFFEKKSHRIVHSSPVVPFDDPTLLFTNAGMNQFKDVFLGNGTREYKRAADTQKCIRVSGKHNDLEEVGHDTYHHTFFEMLGNWSFGDYYKAEAIEWAWELLTEVWKLPKERLFATVYRTDDEAFELWKTKTDIKESHIVRFDEKDNFWEMGETGPCGPCSEIHVNLSDDYDNPKYVNAGVPECIEIWNLVFIQYNRDSEGVLHELPAKHVDTGMGFERICSVLQKKGSNYETDVFSPIIDEIGKLSGIAYDLEENKIAMRVIADHIRTLTFAITDGAVPGNDGRGYVLRRILRRAARYGRKLNLNNPFLFKLVDAVVKNMGDVFPEISEKKDYVVKVIKSEEESFHLTLDRGIELFEKVIADLSKEKKNVVSGADVFRLYDTYGFPVDLTNVMAREKGFSIDEQGFEELMNKQKEMGRLASKDKFASVSVNLNDLSGFEMLEGKETSFSGYTDIETETIIAGKKTEGENEYLILEKTPLYVESGGQSSDGGSIIINGVTLPVVELIKLEGKTIHVVENKEKIKIAVGDKVTAVVDSVKRLDIMRNHSATHFLHAALRNILGTHVQQAGSYVGADRLRFDFTHFAKLSDEEIASIEKAVNDEIRKNIQLNHHRAIPFEDAKKMGALMFFGDKYGDSVNVVQFGNYSMEFCGGTHVPNSSVIGLFKIVNESSIASGVRRIEAVTGAGVEKYIHGLQEQIKKNEKKVEEILEEKKKLEKEIAEFKVKGKFDLLTGILKNESTVNDVKVFKGKVASDSMDELKQLGDEFRSKIKSGIGVLFSEVEGKAGILCVVSDDLIKEKKLSAGKIVGEIAKITNGGGGGRPHLATAGGKDVTKLNEAIEKTDEIIKGMLS